ncbi:MAG: TonB-dependent receptor, partial [Bacteroidia bacterium]|nr:TonB-dependent receptor [Bacteroidia bacterium]
GVHKKYEVYENSYTLESVQAFAAAAAAAGSNAGAVISSRNLLKKSNVAPLKPEQIQSFEVGYKGLIQNKLFIDVSYYYSRYIDFQAQVRVIRPNSKIDGPDANAAAFDIAQGRYRVFQLYTNASDIVSSHGVSVGVNYVLPKGYTIGANYTYAELMLGNADPNIIPSFNTPKHKSNVTFSNRNVYKNIGFNVVWKWVDAFLWESSFGDGMVPAYNLLDAQVSYKLPKLKTTFKLGASNLLNNRHIEAYGAPTVGGMYYFSILFDQFSN